MLRFCKPSTEERPSLTLSSMFLVYCATWLVRHVCNSEFKGETARSRGGCHPITPIHLWGVERCQQTGPFLSTKGS